MRKCILSFSGVPKPRCLIDEGGAKMNSNRGQYASAPLYNMKNKKPVQATQSGGAPQSEEPHRRHAVLAAITGLVLPLFFLLALLIPSEPLRIAFLALALLSVAAMWVLGAFARSARSTLTVVYLALAVVIALALFMNRQSPESRNAANTVADQGTLFSNKVDANALSSFLQASATEEPDTAAPVSSAAQQQLEKFLEYWAGNNIPAMLEICTPAWVSQQQSPEGELWNLMLNRRPLQYEVEALHGSDADSTRTITLKVLFAKEGSSETMLNRMQVLMFRSNEHWYVDPQSLGGTLIDEEAELARQQQSSGASYLGATIAPTATPAPEDSTAMMVLYYNPDGGKYYHAKANCPAVAEQYWPLAQFYYSDLNTTKFKNLIRCPKCNPPARP